MAGVDEFIATGQLAEMIGSDEATEVINELKKILDETQKMTDDEVKQKIREIADDNDVSLTETEISQILTLARTLEGLDVEQLRARATALPMQRAKQPVGRNSPRAQSKPLKTSAISSKMLRSSSVTCFQSGSAAITLIPNLQNNPFAFDEYRT